MKPSLNKNRQPGSERRKTERRLPQSELYLVDQRTGRPLGAVRDLTFGGCKLLSQEPVPTGKPFMCRMALPEPILGFSELNFLAEGKWCYLNKAENAFEVGFEFLDLTDEGRMIIKLLVVPWEAAESTRHNESISTNAASVDLP